jgi:acetyl-CoA acetyltransferase
MTEAFICDYLRTPIGRFGGALAGVRPDDLGAVPLKALMARHDRLDWEQVDDVIYGCANQAGEDNRNVARMSLLLAGLPQVVTGTTINRLCGSGMDACADHRGAGHQGGRGGAGDRRWRGKHVPGALRAAQVRIALFPEGRDP